MANHLNAASASRAWLAAMAITLLTACSPRYDWREVRSDSSGWAALFPGKPQTQTRAMSLDGRSIDMTMTITRVDEISFVLGHATEKNTAQEPGAVSKPVLGEVLRDAMLRNIQGVKKSEQAVQIARAGQGQAGLSAWAVEADGQVGGKAMHLSARFVSYDGNAQQQQAIQMMVLGPPDSMRRPAGQQAVETFLTSLKVM